MKNLVAFVSAPEHKLQINFQTVGPCQAVDLIQNTWFPISEAPFALGKAEIYCPKSLLCMQSN